MLSGSERRAPAGAVALFVLLLSVSTLGCPTPVCAFDGEYVLLGEENIYTFLLRLRALGAPIDQNLSVRPITRGDAAEAVRATRAALDDGALELPRSGREQLRFLERELAPELGTDPPPGRYHAHAWSSADAALRWAFRLRVSGVAEPDPAFVPDSDASDDVSPDTDYSFIAEPLPEATLRIGDRFLVQERLTFFYLLGDGVHAAVIDVGQGEAEISEGDDDTFLHRRTFDTVARLVVGKGFAIEAGRMHQRWGHGQRGTLLLSDGAPPMDVVRVVGRLGRFRLAHFAAELRTTVGQRFLVGHRLSYARPHLTLSVSESVIFGNRSFDFAYVSPFQFFNVVEDNIGAPDNNFFGIDARWRPRPGLELWAEGLLDDWNLRRGLDSFTNKVAVQIGASVTGLPGFPDTDLAVEYSLVDPFTYTHTDSINRATHYDGLVGHRIGTDADLLSASLSHWIGARVQAFARFESERQGEGDVTLDHRTRDGDDHDFLTGVLERTHRVDVGMRIRSVRGIELTGDVGTAWVRSSGNDPDAPRVRVTEARLAAKVEL